MRIAYLVSVHNAPEMFSRMTRKLLEGGGSVVYVHVDARSDITPFIKAVDGVENINFISNRIKTYWGGFSQVTSMVQVRPHGIYPRADLSAENSP